jgi:hypothetical protein
MVKFAMTSGDPDPLCRALNLTRSGGLVAALLLARTGGAAAFPLLGDEDQVPQGTELAAPAAEDLQHQLQLVNGLGAPAGGGWTFVPQISWQEELTDNVLQVHSPRITDVVSSVSPGFSLAGDLPRIQLTFNFAPTLAIYVPTGDLNALTDQLNGLANITLVPDWLFVDVRAVAGVQSAFGGLGGLGGTIGTPAGPAATAQAALPNLTGNTLGLNKDNEFQTSSVAVSPYLQRTFGDWGTGKLGDSLNLTRTDQLSGFLASPLPAGGINGQTLISNEENAHFVTGDFLEFIKDTFDADLIQSRTTADAVNTNVTGGVQATPASSTSSRMFVSDRVDYVLNPNLTVFASGGHEDITFTNQGSGNTTTLVLEPDGQVVPVLNFANNGQPPIHDLTWSLGGTWTPNADSSLTVSYGHLNGFNSFTANGHYAATARTVLTVSYGSTLGTQLENVENQLNLAATNGTGTLINGLTGGSLFSNVNALQVEDGIFRTDTFTLGAQTSLDRDIISINLLLTTQTSSGGSNAASSGQNKTANVSWLHQMRPDMTVSAAISYAIQDQSTGAFSAANPGNSTSIAASLAWQWQITDTVSANVRYAFLEQSSADTAFNIYQNILILGITKRF